MGRIAPTKLGSKAEQLALDRLRDEGLELIQRNFRCRSGEIDLVMRDGDCLVFVEVRSRKSGRFACAAESVDWRKQRKLAIAARVFLARRPQYEAHPVRFDVVALDGPSFDQFRLKWLRDAFRPEER